MVDIVVDAVVVLQEINGDENSVSSHIRRLGDLGN